MKIKTLGTVCVGLNLTTKEIQKLQRSLKSKILKEWFGLAKIISGETRFKILFLLALGRELCVCDIAETLGTTVSAISHQLKILRDLDIVRIHRVRQSIFYSLRDKRVKDYFTRLTKNNLI